MANILLLVKNSLEIPPGRTAVTGDVSCKMNLDEPIHPFAFRTHAHSLGSVITGYMYNADTKKYSQIAKGSPQWPQAFYPMKEPVTLKSNDYLVARCTYNSTQNDKTVRIGMTAGDEMCNLYLMYYTTRDNAYYRQCTYDAYPSISQNLPVDSKIPPPFNPLLEAKAKHSSSNGGEGDSGSHIKSKDLGEMTKEDVEEKHKSGRRKGDLDSPVNHVAPGSSLGGGNYLNFEIQMPGAEPSRDDDYLCTAFSIKNLTRGVKGKKVYVTGFNAEATANKAHHLILQKCNVPVKEEGQIW